MNSHYQQPSQSRLTIVSNQLRRSGRVFTGTMVLSVILLAGIWSLEVSAKPQISLAATTPNACQTSQTNVWASYPITSQTGTFTFSFDATPNNVGTDAVTGLSYGSAASFSDLATIVRFNPNQVIDARNGGVYSAATSIPYTPGLTYHVRMVVNISSHTYSVFVTPPGKSEMTLATNYAFRTEQGNITSLNYWSPISDIGAETVCNANVSGTTNPPSQTPVSYSLSVSKIGTGQGTVSGGSINCGSTCSTSATAGTSITMSAVPASGSSFSGWSGACSGTGTCSVALSGNTSVTAQFAATVVTPPSSGSGSYDQMVLADTPVAFWDISAKTSTETDLAGKGNTATYVGGLPLSVTMPNGDTVADFNGSSQYLTVPSNKSFSIPTTGNLTWEAWIRPDTLQFANASGDSYVDFMGKCSQYSPTCEWESRMYSQSTPEGRPNRISAYVFNSSAGLGSAADWQPNTGMINAGQWVHVVGEYTTLSTPSGCSSSYPGGVNIWVNGVKWNMSYHSPTGCMSQYSIKPQANNSALNIATLAMDTWFKGAIGKVAIYNYLLTQTQINNHYQAMTGKLPTGSCLSACSF